ncbi:MAG: Zn-dependent oligopeptidase [Oligoflexia bacterium]|nr:Zn-dependent oligopeptidase [Oligoflexia bacterium]
MNTFKNLAASLCALLLLSSCSPKDRQFEAKAFPKQTQSQGLLNLPQTSLELQGRCNSAIQTTQSQLDGLTASSRSKNRLVSLDTILGDFDDAVQPLIFMAYVSTESELRDAGSNCEAEVNKFKVAIYSRRDLYNVVASSTPMFPEEGRLREVLMTMFEKNGMKLDDDTLAKVQDLKQQLTQLETEFSKNLNEDVSRLAFSESELAGVPEAVLKFLPRDQDGKVVLTTKSTDYVMIMTQAKDSETRRRMQSAYLNRAPANTKLLEKAIGIRQQIAKALNFSSWVGYRIKGNMADTPERVMNFLEDLQTRLKPRLKNDLDRLLVQKQAEHPEAKSLDAWDIDYYSNQIKKTEYALDNELIKQYFPRDQVLERIYSIYSEMLGIEFVEVSNPEVWHSDVKLYAIYNQNHRHDSPIAYFYADLSPRDGKYGHAAAFPLIAGRRLGQAYSTPVAAIVANFTAATADRPSLLTHGEVETYFHELGHILHQVLTRAPFATLSGTNVAQDFVEAPSQMLENWAWDEDELMYISGHYQNPSEKLPKAIIKKMVESKMFNIGYQYSRQLTFALTDMTIHSASGAVDSKQAFDRTHLKVMTYEAPTDNHFMASFGHMMGGYDAGYYGYLWSEVYAADMFTQFVKLGLDAKSVGQEYRKIILESGNSEDALSLLRKFLGRDPNSDAFLTGIGIQ